MVCAKPLTSTCMFSSWDKSEQPQLGLANFRLRRKSTPSCCLLLWGFLRNLLRENGPSSVLSHLLDGKYDLRTNDIPFGFILSTASHGSTSSRAQSRSSSLRYAVSRQEVRACIYTARCGLQFSDVFPANPLAGPVMNQVRAIVGRKPPLLS